MTRKSWQKIRVNVLTATLNYYSGLQVEVGDSVVVETRYGLMLGKVTEVEDTIHTNPFTKNDEGYRAKKHVLENTTKKTYKEEPIMFGCKTVEVKHVSSNRRGVYYTDLNLSVGDLVVYETSNDGIKSMHVGTVVNADPDALTAKDFVVCAVDLTAHTERVARMKEAEKLRLKLDAKKKQFQDIELLRLIAASDPETKEMLDKYTSLVGGSKQ